MKGDVLVQVSAPMSHKLRDLGNFQIAPSLDDLLADNHKMLHISNIPAGTSEQHFLDVPGEHQTVRRRGDSQAYILGREK